MKQLTLALGLLFALAGPVGAAPAAGEASPAREAPNSPQKALAVNVRSAPLADVLARTSEAAGVPMSATGPAGDQRVTLFAPRATAGELQDALLDLLRLRVSRRGSDTDPRTSLILDSRQAAQAEAWRLKQADAMLQAVFRTAAGYASGREAETVHTLAERFRREHAEFPEDALAAIDADYLRQSLLFTPLAPSMRGQLVQTHWLSLPLVWLPSADQALLASFAQDGAGRSVLAQDLNNEEGPTASRVQYRLLYGDRWTDRMLLAQVGATGAWSSAMLPSILFLQKDDSDLYPQAADRPDDADVWRRLPPRFETAGKDWDALLVELAKSMQIKLAADSYLRPWLFNTGRPLPVIAGIPLRDALDRLCRERGYFWWKQNGWYFLRSRSWVEEARVAVPDRLLRGWLNSIHDHAALSDREMLQLATLSDEQLLTMEMLSHVPGAGEFLGFGFDPDQAALLANALLLFRTLPAPQRELALTDGLPALWLPSAQQNLFATVAAQYRMPLLPEEAESWGFRLRQDFVPPRPDDAAAPESSAQSRNYGSLTAEWRFGPGRTVRASLTFSDRPLHQRVERANPPEAR